jgi:hypothetical protein
MGRVVKHCSFKKRFLFSFDCTREKNWFDELELFLIFGRGVFENDDYLNYEPYVRSSDNRGVESHTSVTPF